MIHYISILAYYYSLPIQVFTSMVPFYGHSSVAAMFKIMEGERPPRPTHPGVTGQLWKLMQQCWDQNPCLRPKVLEVLQILHKLSVCHFFWFIYDLDVILMFSNPPPWRQLISPGLPTNECIRLIISIFSDHDEARAFEYLSGNDAQTFVDTIDKVGIHIFLLPECGLVGSH